MLEIARKVKPVYWERALEGIFDKDKEIEQIDLRSNGGPEPLLEISDRFKTSTAHRAYQTRH